MTDAEMVALLSYKPPELERQVISAAAAAPPADVDDAALDTHDAYRNSLGLLGTIPLELLQEVLRYCTLHALISLGFVNRFATWLVSSSSPYTLIVAHAPSLLATLLQTDAAFYFTAREVWAVLSSPACCVCGFYGQYMYMPECVRCCERCLRRSPRFWPITPNTLEKAYGVTLTVLRKADVPIIKSLRGTRINDRKEEVKLTRSILYMSERSAWQVAVKWHGREDVLERYVNRRPVAKQLHDARLNGLDWFITDELYDSRFRATTYLPYIDPTSGNVERGICCRGCRVAVRKLYNSNLHSSYWTNQQRETVNLAGRAYTRARFLQHIQKCPTSLEVLRSKGVQLPEKAALAEDKLGPADPEVNAEKPSPAATLDETAVIIAV